MRDLSRPRLPLRGNGRAVTVSTPLLDLTQEWNAGGVAFTGLKLNVTDTASASGSLLMDLQVGGVSKVSFTKAGAANFSSTILATATIINTYQDSQGFPRIALGPLAGAGATLQLNVANTFEQRNGVNPQASYLYGFYTDVSNYERLQILTQGGNTRIFQQQAGTGTARGMDIGTTGATDLGFVTGGGRQWKVDGAAGHLLADSDNARDIGASAASRPRNVYAGTAFILADGVTAPTATVGAAKLFVDTADGDLKIIFGDGTTKTIATDT